MENFKRIMSALLVLVLLIGLVPVQTFGAETQPDARVDTGDVSIEGSNGFGTLLSESITEHQEAETEAEAEYEPGYTVTDLEIEGNVATVSYDSMEEALLVVALYSEDGMQMLTSGKTTVIPGENTAMVTFADEMPEYFLASAYLVDTYDLSPLCPAYDTPLYTREMQELLESTVGDYDADLVLNLDESEETNFAVYAETTKIIDYAEDMNIVASADEETHTYVIENADEQFTSLSAGEIVAYSYGENELLILKVGTIETDGTTVTLTGDENLELEEVFSHVKIEGQGDNGNVTVDDSTAAEGVVYQEAAQPMQTYATNSRDGGEEEAKKSIEVSFEGVKVGGDALNVSLTGGAKLEMSLKFKYYITYSYQRVEVRLTKSLEGTIALSAKAEGEILLGAFYFEIIPGILTAGWDLNFVVKFEANIEAYFILEVALGAIIEHGEQGWNLDGFCIPNSKIDTKAEGTAFLGLELKPQISVAKGMLADIKLTAACGLEAKLIENNHEKESRDIFHACDTCFAGELRFLVNLQLSAKFLKTEDLSVTAKLLEMSRKLADFYWSLDFDEFAWGVCPHIEYRLTVTAVGEGGDPIENAQITIGNQIEITDQHGNAYFLLPVKEYLITATYGELVQEYTLYMDTPQKIIIDLSGTNPVQILGGIWGTVDSEMMTDYGYIVDSGFFGAQGKNIMWQLYSGGLLVISGEGEMLQCDERSDSPWYRYGDLIKKVRIENGPTDICNYAFWGCENITDVEIPESVLTIGKYAFYGCKGLNDVTIPDDVTSIGNYAFANCTNLTKVTMSKGLREMGYSAFYKCENLASILIPGGVATIQDEAFAGCIKLTSVTILDGVTAIGNGVFADCFNLDRITIPESVTAIGDGVFCDCSSLTNVTIPDGVAELGDSVFSGCEKLTSMKIPNQATAIGAWFFEDCASLTSVEIPDGVTTIGDEAFWCCTGLSELSIPDSVTSIGDRAFWGCTGLSDVSIPDSVTYIGYAAFESCVSLTSMEIPASVTTMGDYVFSNCSGLTGIFVSPENSVYSSDSEGVLFDKNKTLLIQAPGAMTGNYAITSSVSAIKNYAFFQCDNLTGVTIPAGVSTIGDYAFSSCDSLTGITVSPENSAYSSDLAGVLFNKDGSLLIQAPGGMTGNYVIPDTVSTIRQSAFSDCLHLNSVTIPDSVTSIYERTFYNCDSLSSVVIPDSVKFISGNAFSSCDSLRSVTIPAGVTHIMNVAFDDCKNLTCVVFAGNAPAIDSLVFRNVTATAYYPADNTTWTSAKMKDYGGTITWVPYTLDENGDMVTNTAAVVTVSAPANVDFEPIEEGIMTAGLGNPTMPDFGDGEETQNPDAVYGGEYGTEVTDTYTVKTASFTGLVPGQQYVLLAMKSIEVDDLMAPENLLFIDQAPAAEDGTLSFRYVQREAVDISYVVACGASNKDLSDAEITFPDMSADGMLQAVDPTVVYNGETLTEGQDYVLLGSVSFTEGGEYTCYVRGIRNYTGLVECTYTVTNFDITTHPGDVTAKPGDTAEFSVVAEGEGLTYQWQYKTPTGEWKNTTATGAKTAVLKVSVTAAKNGYQYRCRVTDASGKELYSEIATLTVAEEVTLEITQQPTTQKVKAGIKATFSVEATGENLTYQWQFKKTADGGWSNCTAEGNKTSTMKVDATTSKSSYYYRCKITDGTGNTVTSNVVRLYVLGIKTQPTTQKVKAGTTATFTVSATGSNKTYQWQYKTSSDGTWKSCTAEGNKTATLKVSATTGKSSYYYRCKITDSADNVVYTNVVRLYVLGIKTQPTTQKVKTGTTATFTVSATGSNKTYQWQYKTSADGTWQNCTATGNKTATLKVSATTGKSSYYYRCVIKDEAGNSITSKTVRLYVLGITTQPAAKTAKAGTTVKFTVAATGAGKTYQWQYRTSATGTWKNATATGNKTATLQVPVTAAKNGYQYRCIVKDNAGNSVTSNAAKLTVK